ncbi:unnamed protein product, partial [marine sediment metagenome]
GKLVRDYFIRKRLFGWLSSVAKKSKDKVIKLDRVNDFWSRYDISSAGISHEGDVELERGKKPEALLKRIIELITVPGDIILDFFIGSGTTAAVAHKLRRQYIGIEQIDYGENDSVGRLKNVINGDQSGISKTVGWKGGGDFVYCELMKWNESYIDKIQKAKTKTDLAKIWAVMRAKGHISYRIDLKEFDKNAGEFEQLSFEDQRKFLLEVLDKNQLYVNYCEIDDTDYKISAEDKKLNKLFYG